MYAIRSKSERQLRILVSLATKCDGHAIEVLLFSLSLCVREKERERESVCVCVCVCACVRACVRACVWWICFSSYPAPVTWNQLPASVCHASSISSFKFPWNPFSFHRPLLQCHSPEIRACALMFVCVRACVFVFKSLTSKWLYKWLYVLNCKRLGRLR